MLQAQRRERPVSLIFRSVLTNNIAEVRIIRGICWQGQRSTPSFLDCTRVCIPVIYDTFRVHLVIIDKPRRKMTTNDVPVDTKILEDVPKETKAPDKQNDPSEKRESLKLMGEVFARDSVKSSMDSLAYSASFAASLDSLSYSMASLMQSTGTKSTVLEGEDSEEGLGSLTGILENVVSELEGERIRAHEPSNVVEVISSIE